MKNYFVFALIMVLASCHKENNVKSVAIDKNSITIGDEVYIEVNESELIRLKRKGIFLECNGIGSRVKNCKWSDDYGGYFECDGVCKVYETTNEDGVTACIFCIGTTSKKFDESCRKVDNHGN